MEARTEMLIAAYKAGFAFTRAGVGNVHAIAHTLGGLYNTPHGLANAVILPIVLEDYGEVVYPKLAHLAELTGLKTEGSIEEKAKAFIAEIRAMNARMEIPTGFDHIKEEDIPQMIEWALAEANPVYPVPIVYDEARCEKVIRTRKEIEHDRSIRSEDRLYARLRHGPLQSPLPLLHAGGRRLRNARRDFAL